jgi:phosphohistidine phosphatase
MLGRWLRNSDYLADQVFSSTAVRTLETYQRLGTQAAFYATPNLYLAGTGKINHVLQRATGNTVLILGHNPIISAFTQQMVRPHPAHPHFATYPSCAMLPTKLPCVIWQLVT